MIKRAVSKKVSVIYRGSGEKWGARIQGGFELELLHLLRVGILHCNFIDKPILIQCFHQLGANGAELKYGTRKRLTLTR